MWRKLCSPTSVAGSGASRPAAMKTSGSASAAAAGPARASGCSTSSGVASQRRYSCSPGAGSSPSVGREPRPRQVALDQNGAPPGRASGAGEGDAKPAGELGAAADQQAAGRREPLLQRRQALEIGLPQRPDLRGARLEARDLGEHGQLAAARPHHIRSGAEIPSSPSVAAIVRFVARQSARRERSMPSPSAPTTWQSR